MVVQNHAYTDISLKDCIKDHDTLPGTHSAKIKTKYKKLTTWFCSPLLPLAANFQLTQVLPHWLEEVPEYLVRQPRSHSRIYEKMLHKGKIWGNWFDRLVGIIMQYTSKNIRSKVSFIPHDNDIVDSSDHFQILVSGKSQALHSKLDSQQIPVILINKWWIRHLCDHY